MSIRISPAPFESILSLRDLYRAELDCQIVHDSAHYRENCSQSHLIELDDRVAGYASIWTGSYWMDKGSLFEFYLTPAHQTASDAVFQKVLQQLNPPRLYAQTNDPFLGPLTTQYAENIVFEHILFSDDTQTRHTAPAVTFRRIRADEKDQIFTHHVEPTGDWALDLDGQIIATGGVLYHYNRPYGDIFMEVDGTFRRQGYGRFLVQSLKKQCYESGNVPAARCRPSNIASHKTLEAAGFIPCARLIHGKPTIRF